MKRKQGGNFVILAVFWIARLFQKEKRISEEATEKSLSLPPGFVVESRRNSILRRKSIDLSKVGNHSGTYSFDSLNSGD